MGVIIDPAIAVSVKHKGEVMQILVIHITGSEVQVHPKPVCRNSGTGRSESRPSGNSRVLHEEGTEIERFENIGA